MSVNGSGEIWEGVDGDRIHIAPSFAENLIAKEIDRVNRMRADFKTPLVLLLTLVVTLPSIAVAGRARAVALPLAVAILLFSSGWLGKETWRRRHGGRPLTAEGIVKLLKDGSRKMVDSPDENHQAAMQGQPVPVEILRQRQSSQPKAVAPIGAPAGSSPPAARDPGRVPVTGARVAGARVRHPKLGDGTVLGYEQEGPHTFVVVQWDDPDAGIKSIRQEGAPLTYLNGAARPRGGENAKLLVR